jgi:hypothetical protein
VSRLVPGVWWGIHSTGVRLRTFLRRAALSRCERLEHDRPGGHFSCAPEDGVSQRHRLAIRFNRDCHPQ